MAIPLLVFGGLVVLLAIGLTRNPREVPSPLIG
ncbi:MAG: DsbE family thiol:disulfide interchange protein, partial [Betaproteobacteria bacterium]|nr:DsbE family thiol:disulfide interchange protein [Betaproteobacteria bacterium]